MMKYIGAQNGKIGVFEKEKPQVKDNYVLIKTLYSAISPGTELSMSAASEDRVVALGYSACGEIVEVGDGVEGYKVGEKVASYGVPYTGHREYLSVPKTLIAKVPDNVSDKEASMAGLGAIAIHALRKANLQFGEIIVVVGLGIYGQLIAQMGRAAGLEVLALNRSKQRADLLEKQSKINCYSDEKEMEIALEKVSLGKGADAVFLCAGGDSNYLTNKSLEWLRDKGKSIIVGDIQPNYNRGLMFSKEIDIMISRAGGPGRYDTSYERDAIDYPYGQVRWTEGRNIAEYLRMLSNKSIAVDLYYDHERVSKLEEFEAAYELLSKQGAEFLTHVFTFE